LLPIHKKNVAIKFYLQKKKNKKKYVYLHINTLTTFVNNIYYVTLREKKMLLNDFYYNMVNNLRSVVATAAALFDGRIQKDLDLYL
jgi:hypothetical protein